MGFCHLSMWCASLWPPIVSRDGYHTSPMLQGSDDESWVSQRRMMYIFLSNELFWGPEHSGERAIFAHVFLHSFIWGTFASILHEWEPLLLWCLKKVWRRCVGFKAMAVQVHSCRLCPASLPSTVWGIRLEGPASKSGKAPLQSMQWHGKVLRGMHLDVVAYRLNIRIGHSHWPRKWSKPAFTPVWEQRTKS